MYACHMAKRRVGAEYSPSMLEPVRPGAVSPGRALCLPTFNHFLIVKKTSLSRSLSRSLSLSSLPFFSLSLSRSLANACALFSVSISPPTLGVVSLARSLIGWQKQTQRQYKASQDQLKTMDNNTMST